MQTILLISVDQLKIDALTLLIDLHIFLQIQFWEFNG